MMPTYSGTGAAFKLAGGVRLRNSQRMRRKRFCAFTGSSHTLQYRAQLREVDLAQA
jgi:hypothetical protein